MKKAILPIMAALFLSLGLSSCDHQTMETMQVTIYPDEWSNPAGSYVWVASVPWGVLDEDVVDYGTVNAYLIDRVTGRQYMLPYVTTVEYDDGQGNYTYEVENISFDYRYGVISFVIEDVAGDLPSLSGIGPLTFRVVAIGE